MALSETFNETAICNMSLAKLGASKTLKNVETDVSEEARECRLHYEPTRDALLRSHYWPFAAAREELTEDTESPAFEYDNQFILPADFKYLRSIFADNFTIDGNSRNRHAIEGKRLLTNNSTVDLRYTKKVTDVAEFDSLFIEVLVLQLALKLTSLAGATPKIRESLKDDLKRLMPSVRSLSRQEAELTRKLDWNDVRRIRNSRSGAQRGSF